MSDIPQPAKTVTVTAQPQAGIEMNVSGQQAKVNGGQQCEERNRRVSRLRGGGAGKDCFLGLIGCFLCFGTCNYLECCDCIGDIICCPCEMCC
ncbi:hypothetical protein L218DRAFT_866281 [Marasmius fiardii PR-910]|nr:hypothetical protein L218DRAFT_866281 [Marasmius fiardii PR-910]